jgi:uncharacterized membrane protein YgcG
VSYVTIRGLSLAGLGAAQAGQAVLADLDAEAVASMPAAAKTAINNAPISSSMKTALKTKPISTLLTPITMNRNKWIQVVNLAASYAGLGAKKNWKFYGVTFPAVKVEDKTPDLEILALFFAIAHTNLFAVMKALVVVSGKFASGVANGAAQALVSLLKGVGLGEGISASTVAAAVGSGLGLAGTVVTTTGGVATVTAPAWVPMLMRTVGGKEEDIDFYKETQLPPKSGGADSDSRTQRPGGSSGSGGSSGGDSSGGGAQQQQAAGGLPAWIWPAIAVGGLFLLSQRK